jgi:hypothetical protein
LPDGAGRPIDPVAAEPGALDEGAREVFVEAYTRVLIAAWSSELYVRRLHDDPVDAVAEHGLHIADGATLVVLHEIPPEHDVPNLDVAVTSWLEGVRTGRYLLYVPSTPQMKTGLLTDDDLASVIAGYQVNQCCCTPCCCCQ